MKPTAWAIGSPALRSGKNPATPPASSRKRASPAESRFPRTASRSSCLAEQTVGGYAKIATVISGDLDFIGQAIPGSTIRFQRIDLAGAYELKRKRQLLVERIKTSSQLIDDVRALQRQCAAEQEDDLVRQFAGLYPECG